MKFKQAKKGVKVRIIPASDPRCGKVGSVVTYDLGLCGLGGTILQNAVAPTAAHGSLNPTVRLDDGRLVSFPVWALEAVSQ